MIREASGNLLRSGLEALVNPVNCVGVMGAGLAAQFKREYGGMFLAYKLDCLRGEVRPGRMHVVRTQRVRPADPRYIINFPTKNHWGDLSEIGDIKAGLIDLRVTIRNYGISSIAVPALGCGLGGLKWPPVQESIIEALGDLDGVDVAVYPPAD